MFADWICTLFLPDSRPVLTFEVDVFELDVCVTMHTRLPCQLGFHGMQHGMCLQRRLHGRRWTMHCVLGGNVQGCAGICCMHRLWGGNLFGYHSCGELRQLRFECRFVDRLHLVLLRCRLYGAGRRVRSVCGGNLQGDFWLGGLRALRSWQIFLPSRLAGVHRMLRALDFRSWSHNVSVQPWIHWSRWVVLCLSAWKVQGNHGLRRLHGLWRR